MRAGNGGQQSSAARTKCEIKRTVADVDSVRGRGNDETDKRNSKGKMMMKRKINDTETVAQKENETAK
jgi:hypothetical protein